MGVTKCVCVCTAYFCQLCIECTPKVQVGESSFVFYSSGTKGQRNELVVNCSSQYPLRQGTTFD